jgi:hypothetical protein
MIISIVAAIKPLCCAQPISSVPGITPFRALRRD